MNRYVLAAMTVLFLAQPARAQFGSLSKPPGGGGGLSAGEIDKFIGAAKLASDKMNKTQAALAPFVLAKEDADAYEREKSAALAMPDSKEKDAKIAEIEKKYAAKVAERLAKGDAVAEKAMASTLEKASPEKRKNFQDVVENFLTAAAADVALAIQGKKLATQKPDLSAAAKAPELATASKDIIDQATAGVNVASSLKRLATTAKIDIPASSFSKVLDNSFPS